MKTAHSDPTYIDDVTKTFDDSVRNYSRQIEEAFGPLANSHEFFFQYKADLIRKFVAEKFPGRRIKLLDVGCGMGLLHKYLKDEAMEVHGVDISKKSLEYAAEHNPHVAYHHNEGDTLPLATSEFDLVFAACVIHHVPVSLWDAFLKEMARVARGGGYVMVLEHNPLNPATQWVVRSCDLDRDAVLLPPWKVRGLFRNAGLRSISTRNILFTPFKAGVFRTLDRLFSKVPLGAQYVVEARKLIPVR